jgi:AcrR family transcriptional regulator
MESGPPATPVFVAVVSATPDADGSGPGGQLRKVDDADAAKARSLRDKGIAATDIAKMLGVSRATIYRYLADDAAA